jgi:hypothetical protein
MYGHLGISKTISFMLYSKLSSYIIKYMMHNSHNQNDLKKEMKVYNIIKVPKIVYWTLKADYRKNNFSFIYNNILRQFN